MARLVVDLVAGDVVVDVSGVVVVYVVVAYVVVVYAVVVYVVVVYVVVVAADLEGASGAAVDHP
mgnify:CR=1 FL=1